MACTAAMSSSATITMTTVRSTGGTSSAPGASLANASASVTYWRLMRMSSVTRMGISTMMAQAPWVNLVMAMITHTMPESPAPMPLTTRPPFQPGSLRVT